MLDAAVDQRLTMVYAPAGYGKSTLLGQWAAERTTGDRLAWVRLDPVDDNVTRLYAALHAALAYAGAVPTVAKTVGGPESGPRRGTHPVDHLDELIDGFARGRERVTLVLDDAHVLTNPGVLRALDYLLEFAPDTLHLVLAQRTVPSLRIDRLRLAGELTTIGIEELAFTPEETAGMFERAGIELGGAQLDTVQSLTEGWGAGLALALLWLDRTGSTVDGLTAALRSGAVTTDYLRTEVLARLTEAERAMLARLAVVDRPSPALAAALAGEVTASRLLAELGRQQQFLFPEATSATTDPVEPTYRWHPLLSAALRRELALHDPGAAAKLHRRAADWYSRRGAVWAAIRHAQQSLDTGLLARLVADNWLELARNDRRNEARAALDALPADIAAQYPELSIVQAATHLADGEPTNALALVEQTLARLDRVAQERRPMVAALAAAIQLHCSQLASPPAQVREVVLSALRSPHLAAAGPAVTPIRGFLSLALAVSDRNAGPTTSLADLRQLTGDARTAGPYANALDAHARLSGFSCYVGALDGAEIQATEVIEASGPPGTGDDHAVGLANLTLGWVAFLRGTNGPAREHAELAADLLAGYDIREHCLALRLATLLHLSEHAPTEARAVLHRAYALGATGPMPADSLDELLVTEADLVLAEGDFPQALRLVGGADGPQGPTLYRPAFLVAADAHLRMDNPRAAMRALYPWLERRDIGLAVQIGARAMRAAAETALGNLRAALLELTRAVGMAIPSRIVRPLLDTLYRLAEPVAELTGSDLPEGDFLRSLLVEGGPALLQRPQPTRLPQPLTPRELDILRYLRSRFALAEIADILRLSPNTVKTHVKHIYEKLQVTGRQEAVQRAADLNLL